MKKILITGIGGYIGSALAMRLQGEYELVGYGSDRNFAELKKKFGKSIKLVAGDIADEKAFGRAAKGADMIIHTASPTSNKYCVEHPGDAVRSIVRGTVVARNIAEREGAMLVHFSTQAVYSLFQKRRMPLREEDALMPDDLYGVLKAEAEWEIQKIHAVILRPSNVYGEGGSVGTPRDTVITRYIRAAKAGEPLVMYGNGSQSMDFIHIRDVVELVAQVLKTPRAKKVRIFNVGSGKALSIKEIANLVIEISDSKSKMISQPPPNGTIAQSRWLANAKAKTILKSFPVISFKQGIQELIQK
jgi:UDP-glucose 4-epimerase